MLIKVAKMPVKKMMKVLMTKMALNFVTMKEKMTKEITKLYVPTTRNC